MRISHSLKKSRKYTFGSCHILAANFVGHGFMPHTLAKR